MRIQVLVKNYGECHKIEYDYQYLVQQIIVQNFTEVKMERVQRRRETNLKKQQTRFLEILYGYSVLVSVRQFNDQQNFCQIQLYKYIDKVSIRRMNFKLRGLSNIDFINEKILFVSHYIFSIK
ncbi:unnamed protein product [Paramecium sonneborni]|uniref:Uncharacterized protein n=1 Tax=Paramecium sonneborni TaxID=65129 RepID=A0A8S1NXH7_9CILI|nr:unnamed protein product [Paramecium sonneborni]